MTNRKQDDAAGLSGAYALNALSAEEAALVEAHLAESEEARAEVTELSDTAVLLGLAVDPQTPPPALRASILAQIATTPQLPRDEPVTQPAPGSASERAQRRWFARPVTVIAAAAAAVALVVGGGVLIGNPSIGGQHEVQADAFTAITTAADSQRLESPVTGGGTATLIWSPSLKSSALVVDGIVALPAGSVYQLWYIDGSGARSAGLMTTDTTGASVRVLDGVMAPGDTVGLTVEPAGGSTVPSTTPVVTIAS